MKEISKIKVKNILEEDFTDYKKPAMLVGFPSCSFKCEKDAGLKMCQNEPLTKSPTIEISISDLFKRYVANSFTEAIVCAGLEPLDSFDELYGLVKYFRENNCFDDFVIYTGYCPEEVFDKIGKLGEFKNIIVKFGRFIPNDESKFDDVLGITLASKNQYAIEL